MSKRLLPELIKQACERHGIDYATFSDDWVLRLEKDDVVAWIVGYRFGLNDAASDRLADDKVAQYLALQRENIPCIEHYLVKSLESPAIKYDNLSSLDPHLPYVVKPLNSSGGRDIRRYMNLQEALRSLDNDEREEWAISPCYQIVQEKRLIVLDKTVLLAYEKLDPTDRQGLRMFNLGLGARPRDCHITNEEKTLAVHAMHACGLRLGAVDIVTLDSGEQRVIEINSGIMTEYYARHSTANYEKAGHLYDLLVSELFHSS